MMLLLDHLWQSTLFAGVIAALTLLFRNNGASVRYALWFAASLKFLVPFAALMAFGHMLMPTAPLIIAPATLYRVMPAAQPFTTAIQSATPAATSLDVVPLLLTTWIIGALIVAAVWLTRWLRLAAVLRAASPANIAPALPAKLTDTQMEPGLIGILHPVLLLPRGIVERLAPDELESVIAHELCHARRHDNLTAAIHMLVSALFWFHPLVWCIGHRLIEERERACDEAVLAGGNAPDIYATSILKVCRFTLQSPLACAARVSGADLKNRMETIMENRNLPRLSTSKKTLLAAAAATAFIAPLALGFSASASTALLAEQKAPRKEIAIDPASFDKFAGYYRLTSSDVYFFAHDGNTYFARMIGQQHPDQIYPDSANEFFLKGFNPPAQFSFTTDASGRVTEMVLHQAGEEQHAARISDAEGKQVEAALADRFLKNTQSPGTEAALRKQVDGLISGNPDYDVMAPALAAGTKQMLPDLHKIAAKWGPVSSVQFTGVAKNGMDTYLVTCSHAKVKWWIAPLTTDGRISSIFFDKPVAI